MLNLKDKNIVVMGVTNKWSIAWACAQQLHEAGANLIFTYFGERSLRSIEKLAKSEGVEGKFHVSCDVTSDEDIENAFTAIKESCGVIHGVVHSIAFSNKDELAGRYCDTSRAGYALAQDVSSFSLVAVSKHASKYMTEGGGIVTMSYLGGERVVKNYNVMGVAKAALEMSVRYLAHDLGPDAIRVNGISAGPIKTISAKGVSDFDKLCAGYEEKAPLKRMVDPKEVGNTATFLLSDMSSGITGEIMHVDCGYNILGY
ncbi:enoyl-ACP reductase FabI [Acidaminobacter sp. JC074]|uniref:enoyl-ACP reductase FabI n=1 Tax=Acidaminobacter sp. JC074 TaxID=2530199 RepID=UPI001F10BB51|nr:enoyl-ACP reductase FabI [Acidaminobacter sp. JC074]MCH4889497.1 enoyl-ACP reductase FabI [Acidaminobacter sp. JC074]